MTLPISFIVIHFVADFVMQSNWMAINKSKSLTALTTHVVVYTLTFYVGLWLIGYRGWPLLAFCWMTFVFHWLTDAVTSRITSMLWFFDLPPASVETHDRMVFPSAVMYHSKRHWFFVAIGADQVIHYALLSYTMIWLS